MNTCFANSSTLRRVRRVVMLGFVSWISAHAQSLSCALSLNPDPVVAGHHLSAQITITNATSSNVSAVVVRLSVPNGIYLSSSNAVPTPDRGGGYSSGDLCAWTLGILPAGESRVVTASFEVFSSLSSGTTISFRPVVTATGISDIQLVESVVVAGALPLRVLLDQDRDPIRAGETFSYTATVANAAGVNAPNSALTITLPAGLSFLAASHDGMFSGGIVRWQLGTLSSTESLERSVTVAVPSGVSPGSLIVTRASVTDTTVPQNSARATLACATSATSPVVARISVNPNPVLAGGTLRTVITVANLSSSDYGNVTVRLFMPDSVYMSSSQSYPGPAFGGGYSSGDVPVWNLGTVQAGQTRTILAPLEMNSNLSDGAVRQLRARVDASGGVRSIASQSVVVDSSPVLTVALDEDRDPVAAGGSLSYSVVIGNRTNISAPNVVIRATIPIGTTFVSADGGATQSNGIVTWNLGAVGGGRSGIRRFTVRVNNDVASGSLLTARITAEDTLDPQNTARTVTHTSVRPVVPLTFGFSFASNIYTLSIGNRSSADLGGVVVYALTPDYAFISSSATIPATDLGGGYSSGNLARWTLGSLFGGQTRTVVVPTSFSSSAGLGTLVTYQGIVTQSSSDLVLVRKLTLRFVDPAQITLQPRSNTVTLGGTATFSVAVGGSDLVQYQWRFNGQAISGATSPALTLINVQAAQAGSYTVAITDSTGQTIISDAAMLTVNTNDARLVNLSIRSNAGTGAQTLIVGFNLSSGSAKQLLIRGIGPTLSGFGVGGALTDPQLQLFSGSTVVATNDNWGGGTTISATAASVGAFALPGTSRDAVLLQTLNSGGYTAQIGGGSGVALVELYDAGGASGAKLTNVSARTQVGTGGDILIAGFAIGGTSSKTLLIRAVGPTLGSFGVTGVLADPRLDLFSGSTLIQSNDNWGGTAALGGAFTQVGAFNFPAASRDAALLVTLQPGSYTAQISGANNTTGVALVEVYEMP